MNGPGYTLLGIENVGSNPASLPEVQSNSLQHQPNHKPQSRNPKSRVASRDTVKQPATPTESSTLNPKP